MRRLAMAPAMNPASNRAPPAVPFLHARRTGPSVPEPHPVHFLPCEPAGVCGVAGSRAHRWHGSRVSTWSSSLEPQRRIEPVRREELGGHGRPCSRGLPMREVGGCLLRRRRVVTEQRGWRSLAAAQLLLFLLFFGTRHGFGILLSCSTWGSGIFRRGIVAAGAASPSSSNCLEEGRQRSLFILVDCLKHPISGGRADCRVRESTTAPCWRLGAAALNKHAAAIRDAGRWREM
nr:uncharacterized protein LOC127343008 [Lolium perenne]